VVTQGESHDDLSDKSDIDDNHDLVIGSSAQMAVLTPRGRNNLVKMTCSNQQCTVLLESGAVKSVVGAAYLSQFCADWRKFVLKIKPGRFHSCSSSLKPLGIVKVRLVFNSHGLTIQFVVVSGEREAQSFDNEVLRDAKIGPNLDVIHWQQLMDTLSIH
jgi:hypothetical protein